MVLGGVVLLFILGSNLDGVGPDGGGKNIHLVHTD